VRTRMAYPRDIVAAVRSALLALAVFVLPACALNGCGGGGSGGGSAPTGSTGVRVLHASVDSVPLDVISSSSSSVVVSQAFFALPVPYGSLRQGAQTLSLTKALNSSAIVDSFPVTYVPGERYSILLYGNHQAIGIHTALVKDDVPVDSAGSYIRVVNGAAGSSTLSVSITGAEYPDVSFGTAGEYVSVPAGSVTVTSRRPDDGLVAASNTITVEAGTSYTILVAGELGLYTKGTLFVDN